MKSTDILEVASRVAGNGQSNGQSKNWSAGSQTVHHNPRFSVTDSSESDSDDSDTTKLRARFVEALAGHCRATVKLAEVVREMIEVEVERNEAIEWGVEAGLSESYVRATVSRLYSDLVGRENKPGQGRKGNPGAIGIAASALKQYKGSYSLAKKAILAAYRLLEKQEKESAKTQD